MVDILGLEHGVGFVSSPTAKKAQAMRPVVDAATRVALAFLSRLFDWRDALVVVRLKQ